MINFSSFHEFGFMSGIWLPKAYSLHLQGKLNSTSSRIGTSPLFYFSPNHTEQNTTDWNSGLTSDEEYYNFYPPNFTKKDWTPPPLKEKYKNTKFIYDKPLVTINNKQTIEWGVGLFNYFPNNVLENLFDILTPHYKVAYIRPPSDNTSTYIHDEGVPTVNTGDLDLIKTKYPEVLCIEDYITPESSYNEIQMMLLANSNLHISCAGGDLQLVSYFGGEISSFISQYSPPNVSNRGIFFTNSWLNLFSGANINSHKTYDSLIDHIKNDKKWKI